MSKEELNNLERFGKGSNMQIESILSSDALVRGKP